MRGKLTLAWIGMLVVCSAAWGQQPAGQLPPDLAALPDQIKTLKWQNIDTATLGTLEHCRSLLLLNHVLDELSANATAEADLMSTYIEKQNLGQQFANTPPPPAPAHLSYADAQKVAVAMLRGPMSDSYYATELGDVSATGLASYEQLYARTCARRWSELDEARTQVRAMASFLGNAGKMPDYEGWATAEAALRQKQYEQKAGPAAAQQQQNNPQMQALQQQNAQLQQALGAAEFQARSASQQAGQAQQAAAQAQQSAAQAQQSSNQSQSQQQPNGYVVPGYGTYGYGAYGGYGYGYGTTGTAGAAAAGAYAGANAANQHNAASFAAGSYHGSNNSWTHDAGYSSAARSQTEQRMSSFHGAPAAGGYHGAGGAGGYHGGAGAGGGRR